ncbi:hypothetical protein L198_05654 [Cryptococcus wingfieldii CBS 7118]|uniref:Uncharacterized protein n=1 Tax=Cryptococcus wingfieldii CBS 7118 TaxID=1295528 RepID=A0A1E3ITU1_9TREE|nr:hypothetical protein L198_05654 [Cryptococcus wingfieldii CBS 7118]ODN91982.1 hypothetical protein L198_05654 [Cryptococcus wingfieldii CBS 7118]
MITNQIAFAEGAPSPRQNIEDIADAREMREEQEREAMERDGEEEEQEEEESRGEEGEPTAADYREVRKHAEHDPGIHPERAFDSYECASVEVIWHSVRQNGASAKVLRKDSGRSVFTCGSEVDPLVMNLNTK